MESVASAGAVGFLPRRYTLVAGVGCGSTELNAFDAALLDAGVGNYNLVRVSSILPPSCAAAPAVALPPGSVLHIAYASLVVGAGGGPASAAAAVGVPEDGRAPGVIMERSEHAAALAAEDGARRMVEEAMRLRGCGAFEVAAASRQAGDGGRYRCAFAGVALW